MAAAGSRQHGALMVVALLAILAPMACHADYYNSKPLCSSGWEIPVVDELGHEVCPDGSKPTPVSPPSSGYTISETGLSVGYYNQTCPGAEDIVYGVVKAAVDKDPGMGAGLIRLFFHDCFVDGCDASVLLDKTATSNVFPTEKDGPPNKNSLRGFEVIEEAKKALENEKTCAGKVSCADIVAFAARDASKILSYNKTSFAMPAGRLDGRVSLAIATILALPGPGSDLNTLTAMFAAQGLTVPEMVTLSGAHSVGRARCQFISNDTSHTNQTFANGLRSTTCKTSPTGTVDQDHQTPYILDNKYYDDVRTLTSLFDSDAALLNSTNTKNQVYADADSKNGEWEADFARAMVRMGYIRIKTTAAQGEIRKVCSRVNGY